MQLENRRIVLGVTGGIAAYKSAELLRLLKKAGADVQVVMTASAEKFVTALTFQALSGRPVRSDLFDLEQESAMGHIELARWAELVLVAPATANFLATLAQGMADSLLSTLCLATGAPVVVAPAMNRIMWSNAATLRNRRLLEQQSVRLWGPASGEQACGETGEGRMLEAAELLARVRALFSSGPLQGCRVLLTAGPTYEPLDPVRFLGNRSSGKMGFALAGAFVKAGAEVTMVSGPVQLDTPTGVRRIDVTTALEMHKAVMESVDACDIFAACAAVADFRVQQVATEKIKKNGESRMLALETNPDILADVAARESSPFTLGFAAETSRLEEFAEQKRQRKQVDMIAANLVGKNRGGFEKDENELTVLWDEGGVKLPLMDKKDLAEKLVTLVIERFQHKVVRQNAE